MNVYLAARFAARPQMREYAAQLTALGFRVTAHWIWVEGDPTESVVAPAERTAAALQDVGDLMASHMVIAFDGDPADPNTERGGRHVEFGMAVGFGKTLVYVGERRHVFHYLPSVLHYPTWADLLAQLSLSKEKGLWFPHQPIHWSFRKEKT